ncbi:SSI family serine proteinase inhibitor [Streptomyces sp. NBC_00878]|uniref:SSI family serine proteinase inhibitor n=1 Tax=Streptomyces sp. NBC_00878 TaxID=2975854 RepID=UPI002252F102|nr:SSI family serine proteinase inhibitor [Streptomyces sp. NBC_00878]MCX4904586.1 subtilase-type protease inhibitor [Streptomyces sp. NBC_00878]
MTNTHKATAAVRTCLLAACALLVAGSVPARAAAPPESLAGNWLYVTVTRGDIRAGDTDSDTGSGDTRGALLLCDPPQGHAHAVRACGELRAAGGAIGRIPPTGVHCPMIYAPVTASARGEWGGRAVTHTETYANSCVLAARTGAVFALSN